MFLERQHNVDCLNQMLQQVSSEGGRAALIFGEAGIGKSTLIEHFLNQLSHTQTSAIGFCDPYWTPRVLGPVRDIALSLLGAETQPLDEERFFNNLIQHLINSGKTVVLVIEDLHWADNRTLDWLMFISRRLSQLPVLLVVSYRDDEYENRQTKLQPLFSIPAHRRQRIPLQPLSLNAVTELCQDQGFSAHNLHQLTNGNPFFVTEILQSEKIDETLPGSVSEILNARLNALPKNLLELLEVVSCNPVEISLKLLEKTGLQDIDQMCAEACNRKILLQSGQSFEFRHELVRIACYERMTPIRKRATHALLLQQLTHPTTPLVQPDLIAHHAEGAQDEVLILKYLPAAAQTAAQLGAHRDATLYLRTAMRYLDGASIETVATIYDQWAYESSLLLNINDEVIQKREKATQLWRQLGRTDKVSENLSRLSRMHWYRGEPQKAKQYFLLAFESLEDLPPDAHWARARVLSLRAQYLMQQEQIQQAIRWAEQAYQYAMKADDLETVAHALNTLGTCKLLRGDIMGEEQLNKSLSIALQQGYHEQAARAYSNLSECLIEIGALNRVEAWLEEGINFDNRHDLDSWTFYLLGRKAQLRFEQERYAEAIQIAENVLQREHLTLLMKMPAMIVVARAKIRYGDRGVQQFLQQAVDVAEKIGEPQYLLSLDIAWLEYYILADELASAQQVLRHLKTISADLYSPRKAGELIFWSKFIDPAFSHLNSVKSIQPFSQKTTDNYADAAQAFLSQNMKYLAAWALLATDSKQNAEQAMSLFESIQALGALHCKRLKKLHYNKSKSAKRNNPATKKHPYSLTRQELKILSLLIEGLSNNTMANQLSRSRRTIENHVSSVLSKLQCKNRVEAVLRVQNEPWILSGIKL